MNTARIGLAGAGVRSRARVLGPVALLSGLASILLAPLTAHRAFARTSGVVELTSTPAGITFAIEADASATARIRVKVAGAEADKIRLVRLVTNLGEISSPRRVPDGWEAELTPPALEHPAAALIHAEVERAGVRSFHWLSVPIAVRGIMTFVAPTGSRVEARLPGQTFGPVTATRGKASMPVDLPPGATRLEVVVTPPKGASTTTAQPIRLPAFKRLEVAAPRTAESGGTVLVEAFVVDAAGRPFTVDLPPLKLVAEGATLVRREGTRSIQRFFLKAPAAAGDLRIQVSLPQEAGVEATAVVKVEPARRFNLALSVDPHSLQVGTSQAAVVLVTVTDENQAAADVEGLEVLVNGRPFPVEKVATGEYRGFLYAPKDRQATRRIEIRATAPRATAVRASVRVDGGGATELAIRVGQAQVLADGQSGVTFEVEARDRFGLPAAERELRVDVENGTLDYLHRIRAGLFRGRFVPRRSIEAGRATVTVSTSTVRPVTGEVRLLPVSQRWFLVPTIGVISDLGRMMGSQVGLRAELAVFRRRPLVVLGLEGQVAVAKAALGVELPEQEAWGVSGGLLFSTRIRPVSTRRFGLDLVMDLGVLGVYARSHIRRSGDHVDPVSDAHPAFTVSAGLDAAVLTRNQGEVIFFARVRYLTASYNDGSEAQSGAFVLGIGYRFAL